MNPAHLHLVITHVPVVGSLFGLGLFLYALCKRSEELKRAGLWALLVAALMALPAYFSGQPAANLLKHLLPGMTMDASDQHQEVGVLALAASIALGIVSLVGLLVFRRQKSLPTLYIALVLVLSLIVCGTMAWTANLGSRIRHDEIRNSAS